MTLSEYKLVKLQIEFNDMFPYDFDEGRFSYDDLKPDTQP
mgnify:CR=1 FL=1